MNEAEKYQQIGSSICSVIEIAVRQQIDEKLSPLVMLRRFDGLDVLTFEETCEVLRLSEEELNTAIKNHHISCLKMGKLRSTWRFSKRQLIALLLDNRHLDSEIVSSAFVSGEFGE